MGADSASIEIDSASSSQNEIQGTFVSDLHDHWTKQAIASVQRNEAIGTNFASQKALPDISLTSDSHGNENIILKERSKEHLDKDAGDYRDPLADINDIADEFCKDAKQLLLRLAMEQQVHEFDPRNGLISKAELAKAMEDPQYQKKNSIILATLYHNFEKVRNLSPEFSNNADNNPQDITQFVSVAGVDKAVQLFKKSNDCINLSMMDKIKTDTLPGLEAINSPGGFTKDQLIQAIEDPRIYYFIKVNLLACFAHFPEIDKGNGTITIKDAVDFGNNFLKSKDGTAVPKLELLSPKDAHYPNTLYLDQSHPLESISPEAVKQGHIGDCYFEAALAAVAKAEPAAIAKMIQENSDGTYTVTFPGAADTPVTIKAPSESEQLIYNQSDVYGTWASVMEKAYGAYVLKTQSKTDKHVYGDGNTSAEVIGHGGRASNVLKVLCGAATETEIKKDASSVLARELANASKNHQAITASVNRVADENKTADGFTTRHAYTITDFVPDDKGGGEVSIRNPHAGGNCTPDGNINIPLATFIKNFSSYTIAEKARPQPAPKFTDIY